MKLRARIGTLTTALLLSGIFLFDAGAQQRPRRMPGPQGPAGFEGGPGGRFSGGFGIGMLDLSDAQKEQIKALVDQNNAATEPYRNQVRDAHQALRDATAKGQFNEAQVRALAQTEAQAQVELTVARERLEAAIYNLLTPEQRAKLDERTARMKERRRPGGN